MDSIKKAIEKSDSKEKIKKLEKSEVFRQFWKNVKDAFGVAWRVDSKILSIIIFLGAVGAVFPIAFGYVFKIFLDELLIAQSTFGVVSAVLLGIFSFRYILQVVNDFRLTYQYQYLGRIFRFKFENYLTLQFSKKISELDIGHFEDPETQNLIVKARQGYTGRMPNFVNNTISFAVSLGTFIGAFLVLLPFGWWIPILMTLTVMPRFWLRSKYSRVAWSVYNQRVPESKELIYVSDLLDDPSSVKELKVFQAGSALTNKMEKLQNYIFESIKKPLKQYLRGFYLPAIFEVVVLGLLVYLKLPVAVSGIITVGSFTFYMQMLDRIANSSQEMLGALNDLYDNNLYISYYFEVLGLPKLIQEKEESHIFAEFIPPKIEFRNVSFGYKGGPIILKKISFTFEPKEHFAIVGPNGAGKSTIIKLLLRFYDPQEGEIFINEINLKDVKLNNWYKFVGTLFQDFVKFSLSIKDNILLGNADVIDENKMKEAAKKSGANEFIEKFSKGYNQRLGKRFEDAVELSQGQWQKLALARAFYEEAPILILDEPTSAIDAEAEAKIFENLDELYKDKSLILVSHRFSTVKNADKIIVLKDGSIIEKGNHQELMKQKGIYARMFTKQASGYLD